AALDSVADEQRSLEEGLLSELACRRQLAVYQHRGFWQCMDTYRETRLLNDLWVSGKAPWKVWD
ncbi:MAG TPA: glucose-1-phosphate cytidylyltransferase, partial [Candidatus Binataceae bacterium]|nr:glucose-1-phosphate cytidylyltransferase [Candidatus Binataceae bacterium]